MGYRRVAWAAAAVLAGSLVALVGGHFWWHPQADDFLGNADFEGVPIRSATISDGIQSTYNGFLIVVNLDRSMVEALLPPGFVLAVNKSFWLKTKHPVLLLWGDQTDGASFSGVTVTPAPPLDRAHYSEVILGIPFVQASGRPGWHTYIVRMYLDDAQAVAGGNLYGYAKQIGCLDWRGAIIRAWQTPVVCPGPNPVSTKRLLKGDFRYHGSWYDGPDADTHIPNLSDMIGMVTTRILGRSEFGTSICSFFEWNLDDAQVAKAKTTHTFEAPFRADMGAWPALGSLPNVHEGAVALRGVRWRMGLAPVACGFP